MSCAPGRERVGELVGAGEVERVTSDLAIARRMLEDAGRHLATASRAKVAGDLSGAYQQRQGARTRTGPVMTSGWRSLTGRSRRRRCSRSMTPG
jgi:hypothetical protein